MDAKQILDEIKLEVARANDFSQQANDHCRRATDLLNTLSDKIELLEKECLVCYESLRDPLRTPCNHVYCAACIRDWLSRGRSVCPYCKQNVAVDDLQSVGGAPVQSRTISDPRSVAPAGVRNAHPRNRDTIDRMDTRFAHLNPLAQFTPGAPQHEVQQGPFDPPRFPGTMLPFTNNSATPWLQLQAQSHNHTTVGQRRQPRRRRDVAQEPRNNLS